VTNNLGVQLTKQLDEVKSELVSLQLKAARDRVPLANLSGNHALPKTQKEPKNAALPIATSKVDEFSGGFSIPVHSEPSSSAMAANVPSAAVAGVPRRSFFRPMSSSAVNRPAQPPGIKSPPVSIREEPIGDASGGECAQQ